MRDIENQNSHVIPNGIPRACSRMRSLRHCISARARDVAHGKWRAKEFSGDRSRGRLLFA